MNIIIVSKRFILNYYSLKLIMTSIGHSLTTGNLSKEQSDKMKLKKTKMKKMKLKINRKIKIRMKNKDKDKDEKQKLTDDGLNKNQKKYIIKS